MPSKQTSRMIAAALITIVAPGCGDGGPQGPLGVTAAEVDGPQQNVSGNLCPEIGDWIVTVDDCPSHFSDQTGALAYSVDPGATGGPTGEGNIWVTMEVRWSANGYGVRYLDGVNWDGQAGTIVTTSALNPVFIRELTETMLIGHTAWCDLQYYGGDAKTCWDAKNGAHFEVGICLPNPFQNQCVHTTAPHYEGTIGGGGFPVHNQLPVAGTITATKVVELSTKRCAVYDLSLSNYSDPEGGALTFTWSSEPASSAWGGSGPAVMRQFCQSGNTSVRVLVEDPQGGMDLAVHDLNVVLGGPGPLAVQSFEIPQPAGANTQCEHRVYVTGGTQPYTYTWTINGYDYGLTPADYIYLHTNTGNGYVVGVTVTDATGASVQREAPVQVQYGNGGPCPSPTPI